MNNLPPIEERGATALSRAQIQGARGMLGWSRSDLGKAAGVSVSTIKRLENGELDALSDGICRAIRAALEGAGVRFLVDGGHGEGVWRMEL